MVIDASLQYMVVWLHSAIVSYELNRHVEVQRIIEMFVKVQRQMENKRAQEKTCTIVVANHAIPRAPR